MIFIRSLPVGGFRLGRMILLSLCFFSFCCKGRESEEFLGISRRVSCYQEKVTKARAVLYPRSTATNKVKQHSMDQVFYVHVFTIACCYYSVSSLFKTGGHVSITFILACSMVVRSWFTVTEHRRPSPKCWLFIVTFPCNKSKGTL